MNVDDLARQAADRVRELISTAEEKAGEIIDEAERRAVEVTEQAHREADQILTQARHAAEEQAERARSAIERLADEAEQIRESLGASAARTSVAAEPDVPEPHVEAEAAPPALDDRPAEPPAAPEPDREAETRSNWEPQSEAGTDDAAAARLIAMKMVLDGASREEVDRHLAENYDLPDRDKLVDEVVARAGK